MRLNGWKRLGVIASVVWIVWAFFYTLNSESDSNIKITVAIEESCVAAHTGQNTDPCIREAEASAERMLPGEREDAAIGALAPAPFAWGFVYLILFLVGWVKRGFNRKAVSI